MLFSSCDDEFPRDSSDVNLSKIMLVESSSGILLDEDSSSKIHVDEASLTFPLNGYTSDDRSSTEIFSSKDYTSVDISLSSLIIPLYKDEYDQKNEDLLSMFDIYSSFLSN